MTQPQTVAPSSWQRLRKPVAAGLGAALLASGAGCMNAPAPKVGGGPAGRNTAAPMRVGFSGFVPGFAYLVGGDERLHVPRRAEPRTRVSAGSVGLAGEFSGIYPRETPGGWQLIGRTDAVLWDVERDPPALLTPGTRVQFRAIG